METTRGSRCLLFMMVFLGLGSALLLGGLVGYFFVLSDFLQGEETKKLYLILIAAAILGLLATITSLFGVERRRKCTLIIANVLLCLCLVAFTAIGFFSLLLGDVKGLAEVYSGPGLPLTELKLHFVRSVWQDCCVASGFGGTAIPSCNETTSTLDDFCFDDGYENDKYIDGLSKDLCSRLEDYTNSSGFRVGEVSFGLCANGNAVAWTSNFAAFVEDKLAFACYVAFSMASISALSIVAVFYVICFINVTYLPYSTPNYVAPKWERLEEGDTTFTEPGRRANETAPQNNHRPMINPPPRAPRGANPFDDGEIANATPTRRSFFRFRKPAPAPEEDTSDGTEEPEVPRRLESISTDASGRFVVDDVSANDFPNDMDLDFSDDESDEGYPDNDADP